jgi:acyl-coenzyme A thioesterase 13
VTGRAADQAGRAPRVPANCELTLGMRCVDRSQPGTAVWAMVAAERMANPVGVVQGGLLTALAVAAMSDAVRGSSRSPDGHPAGSELKISFIKGAAVGEALSCTARVIGGGRRVAFVEAEIADSANTLVAKASSTYLLSQGG